MRSPPFFSIITTPQGKHLTGFRCPECNWWLEQPTDMDYKATGLWLWLCEECWWEWEGTMEVATSTTRTRSAIQEVTS